MDFLTLLSAQAALTADKVPLISIVSIIVSAMLVVAVPTLSIFFLRKRCQMTLRSMMYGISFYVFTGYLLQQIVSAVIYSIGKGNPGVGGIILYTFITVVFEVLGIYGGMLLLRRFLSGVNNVAGFAVGYGAIELILAMGFVVFMFITMILALNSAGLDAAVSAYPEADREEIRQIFQSLIQMPWYEYVIYGIQAVLIAVFRYCTVGVVYGVSIGKLEKKGMFLAAAFCLVFRLPDILYQLEAVKSPLLIEILFVLVTAVIAAVTWKVVNQFMKEEVTEIFTVPKKAVQKMPKIVMPK